MWQSNVLASVVSGQCGGFLHPCVRAQHHHLVGYAPLVATPPSYHVQPCVQAQTHHLVGCAPLVTMPPSYHVQPCAQAQHHPLVGYANAHSPTIMNPFEHTCSVFVAQF